MSPSLQDGDAAQHLYDALETVDSAEKNYHIRQALQLYRAAGKRDD
ncbi:hypothetical protein ACFPM1_07815 [Halorubrum rubrum]|uniref:Uncharacterized protein n=1 Tax=Halorubrum rubrum TaxID=1126240 RepID=A0ABD5R130_9EURY|nr:hypothetical protein [Halorubrum rubrum]